jgi:hypothetical protein
MDQNPNQNSVPEPIDLPPVNNNSQVQSPNFPPIVENPTVSNLPVQPEAGLPITHEVPKPKSKLMPVLLAILIIAVLSVGGYFVYKNYFAKEPVAIETPSPTPVATADPTADWETYTNQLHGITYKYPTKWIIDDKEVNNQLNGLIVMKKEEAQITMYLEMDGIGGLGRNYEGKSFQFNELGIYKYYVDNTYNKTKGIGLTDSLTQSLGVFSYNNKPYSITLTYPASYTDTQASELENEFDQILSTFKFTN